MNGQTITFKFRKEISRERKVVYRPVAQIFVRGSDEERYLFYPYAGSGADITLFRRTDCKLLGLKLKEGESLDIGGVTGRIIKAYIHTLIVRIGDKEFEMDIAFANSDHIPRLLGRKDTLDHFTICFDGKQNETSFIAR